MAQRAPALLRSGSLSDATEAGATLNNADGDSKPEAASRPNSMLLKHTVATDSIEEVEDLDEDEDDIKDDLDVTQLSEEAPEETDNATAQPGGSKGAIEARIGRKVYGRFFPAVRKLVAMDLEEPDSVVRVSLAELAVFLLMILSMTVYTFGRRSETEYYFTKVHRALFTETDSNGDNNVYNGMGTKEEFWTYMNNEFVNGLYWEQWYNGDTPFPYQGYVFGESKILGRAQMRQLRVKEGTCKVHEQFAELISECYDAYTGAGEQTVPIQGTNNSTYPWSSQSDTQFGDHWGQVGSYEGSGYITVLGETKAETLSILQDLEQNLWLDRSTRAVLIDFNLYNANLNLFLIVRLAVEFPPTGGVVVSSNFQNVKLLRYHTTKDFIFAGFEVLYGVMLVYYLIEMVFTGMYLGSKRMMFRFWTWYDMINFVLGGLYLAYSLKSYLDVTSVLAGMVEDDSKYMNFEDLAYGAEVFRDMNGINVFLTWLKLFKYLNFTKTMAELQATLVQSAGDLMGFLFMISIMLVAYAQCGYLIFGAVLRDFSTFPDALFTLFRIILGDFDFFALERANRIMGPIYFITFVVMVFFVLLNMFLAIVADTYSEVKGDAKYGKQGKIFSAYFKKLGSKMRSKLKSIEKLEAQLNNADTNRDNYIDMKELQKAVGHENAKTLMDKFDLSNDQKISLAEKDRMMASLKAEQARMAKMIDANDQKEAGVAHGGMPGVELEEFERLSNRVHRLERSLGTIAGRITTMVNKMEKIERVRARTAAEQLAKKRRESEQFAAVAQEAAEGFDF